MIIGYYQYAPVFLEPEKNLEFLASELSTISCDILVLPELSVSGYNFEHIDQVHQCADPCDGKTARFFRDLSKKTGTLYVYGFAEAFGTRLFNSSAAVDKGGLVHLYRKLHLFDREKQWFSPGNLPLEPFSLGDCRIGMLVCFDHFYPEAARTLALKGAQIICHPSNLVIPDTAQLTTRVRSLENRVFWVLANRTGEERSLRFTGRSQTVSPAGALLSSSDEAYQGASLCEIHPGDALDKHITGVNDLFADRAVQYYVTD